MDLRVGIIGRTGLLLEAAKAIAASGRMLSFVQTRRAEAHYDAAVDEFRALAAAHGAPFLEGSNLIATADQIAGTRTDVVLSMNWPTLVPDSVLGLFRYGILNAHAGDLPRFRGNACPNWALFNFEPAIGLTIHRMTAELDAGPYLYKTSLAVDETTYIGEVYDWLARTIPGAFVAALDRIETTGFVEQDPAIRPLRAFPRRPEDGRIDWRAPARNVLALIRASSRPFAGAFTNLEGASEIRVWRASPHRPDYDVLVVPGQVCGRAGENPIVATGDGLVTIEDCTSEGRDGAATKRLILASLRNRLS